jgi:hypothetical protein
MATLEAMAQSAIQIECWKRRSTGQGENLALMRLEPEIADQRR